MTAAAPDNSSRRQGIQSVEVAGPLLAALSAHEGPMMLKDLALAARMPAAKAHRYLVSLARLKLVVQDAATGRYDLGPFALELGLSALGRLDAARPAARALEALSETLGETIALAAWGTHGATFIRIAEPMRAVTVSLRTGAVAPLTISAIGLVFSAFLPKQATDTQLRRELEENRKSAYPKAPTTRGALDALLEDVRRNGMASAESAFAPGVNSYAAPIFDHTGRIVFSMAVIGYAGQIGSGLQSPVARTLAQTARDVSAQLGYKAAPAAADNAPAKAPGTRARKASPAA
jgi:DNA-binding IclR family transcriptional regulator